jgi:predicted nucleic acid-binding protein
MVIDASAVADLLLATERRDFVELQIRESETAVHAPDLLDVEILFALRRWERRRALTAAAAGEAILLLRRMPLQLHPTRPLLERVWELRRNVTPADAVYVALAERLRVPLLTCDQGLARAAARHAALDVLSPAPGKRG